jgi:hypothetical protein
MSDTPNSTAEFSLEPPKLSADEFDKLYKAEMRAVSTGDNSESKKVGREFFAAESPPVAVAVATPNAEMEPANTPEPTTTTEASTTTTESVADTTTSATEGADSTSSTEAQLHQPTMAEANAWLASLDPKVKAEVDKIIAEKASLEHRLKSDDGRVAQYQRHYETKRLEAEELKKRLHSVQQQNTPTPRATHAASTSTTQSSDGSIPQEIKDVLDVDPVLGKVLLKQHEEGQRAQAALRAEIEALRENAFMPLQQQYEQIHLERELDLLEHEFRDATQGQVSAKEILAHDIWDEFKKVAPPSLRALAESSNREEVKTALYEYTRWISRPDVQQWANARYGAPETTSHAANATSTTTTTNTTATTATTPDPAKAAQAQKVKQEAERKSAATPVGSNTVGRPTTQRMTFDQIIASNDPALLDRWHRQEFENESAKIEGRKPRTIT